MELAEPQPAPPEQDWRQGGCEIVSDHGGCLRDPYVLLDGRIVCEGHLALLWERWQAMGISPDIVDRLPSLMFR